VGVSSLIDTWLLVRDLEMAGERNRGLYILKSRGMAHSNQIREFVITEKGLDLVPVYVGVDGSIYIGAARAAKESEEAALAKLRPAAERAVREVREERRNAFEAELTALRARFGAQEKELVAEQIKQQRQERQAARSAEFSHRGGVREN
jgi:circadian clock protein KaiC